MNRISLRVALAVFVLMAAWGVWAAEEEVALTVYNQDLAFVRVLRDMDLEKGVGTVAFKDVASSIDQTSVHFRSLTDPEGTVILEQNYEYDLVSSSKMFQKYLGKPVELATEQGILYKGTLGSYDGGTLILMDAVKIDTAPGASPQKIPVAMVRQDQLVDVRFPELPEGLIATPTLNWLLQSAKGGQHRVEVSYLAGQINWLADYVAVLEDKDRRMDLTGWVTIDNRSGAAYKNAQLKLMAGDVHRIEQPRMVMEKMVAFDMAAPAMGAPQVEEKELFEYHLYTVTRPVTLKDQQTKQIEFNHAPGVPVRKIFMLESSNPWAYQAHEDLKVDVKLEFRNEKEKGLGIPLPKGRVRVFHRDNEGALEFVGEDQIDHTPKDEKVELKIGKAFDVAGERTRTNFAEDARYYREDYHVTVRNHKKEAVDVTVREHFYRWNEWKLTTQQPYTKVDAQSVDFVLSIPKDATGEIDYSVRYEKR